MFIGTACKNNSSYGIKLTPNDRDRYFSKPSAVLRLEGKAGDVHVNTDKPSFWNDTCMELFGVVQIFDSKSTKSLKITDLALT